jgi:hypothetical protein
MRLTAATNTRSKNSSVHVARRSPSDSRVRRTGGRTAARRSAAACELDSLLIGCGYPRLSRAKPGLWSEIDPAGGCGAKGAGEVATGMPPVEDPPYSTFH